MPVSERKLIANRLNAKKSTGPKTPLGKLRSSRNSMTHGHYSHFDMEKALELLPPQYKSHFLAFIIKSFQRGKHGQIALNQSLINTLKKNK